jgi:hypothetical protein
VRVAPQHAWQMAIARHPPQSTTRAGEPRKAAPVVRRGLGRPRARRRMEPFSSKIEISLRDDVDRYAAKYGESYVDLLDRALRAAIAQPTPGE